MFNWLPFPSRKNIGQSGSPRPDQIAFLQQEVLPGPTTFGTQTANHEKEIKRGCLKRFAWIAGIIQYGKKQVPSSA